MLRLIVIAVAFIGLPLGAEAAEICGNGQDDDADGLADEGCAALTCDSPLSCGDTGMVSPSMGALHYTLPPDVAPRVPYGPSISLTRYYLSMYAPGGSAPAYRKPMGERWGHTYMTWLDKHTTPNPDQIVLHASHGQDILFTFTGSAAGWDTYAPQAGSKAQFQYVRQRVAAPQEYHVRSLTGDVLVYNSSGRLIEIWDTLAAPNKVLLAYDGNSQLSTVTDASGKRRLAFSYTSGVLSSVSFEILVSGAWTQQHTTAYGYTGGNLTTVTIGGQLTHANLYTSSYLTAIEDGDGNTIVNFAYDPATPGKVVRADTTRGMVGWEYDSSRATCSGETVLYFHRGNATSCDVDADCGSGFLCGGKTGAGSTGVCFRGARCLTVASPSHDVVTSITALGPPGESCEGACLDVTQYIWNSGTGVLDLGAVQDPSGNYTVRSFNANGLPEAISYGDPDTNPTNGNGAREVFLYYGDASFPGRVTEIRRQSEAYGSGVCTATNANTCARTLYTYNTDGKLGQIEEIGHDLDFNGAIRYVTRTTTKSYDTKGRITQIDGPLPGSNDVTVFEYWTSSDPFKDQFLQHYRRKKDATTFLTQSSLTFDFWGNATSISDVDGTISCQTFDPDRGYLTERRETMAGQSDCTADATDLVTSYIRDSALRLTRLTRPDGSCVLYEYDTKGRLSKTKRRDDCLTASSGDREEYTYSDDSLVIKIETFGILNNVTRRREMTYHDSRRLDKVLNPVSPSKWEGLTYDARGLLSQVAAVSGSSTLSKTTWTYNADGRIDTENRFTTGTAFDTWNLLFDWIGNQRQVTDGQAMITKSVRDDFGLVVKFESPDLGGFPTLRVHDVAGRLETIREVFGGAGVQTHTFTFDHLGRPLTSQYHGSCLLSGGSGPEIERSFDTLPAGVTCPAGVGCARTMGRLAYEKVSLMCSTAYADASLDQETFYSYDDAGRVVREYIRDDTGRTADHQYNWTQNGSLAQATMPSSAVIGWSYGSASSNSDTDRITALWRTSAATPVADAILWEPYGPLKQYNQQNTSGTASLRTRITRNLAYRITGIYDNEPQAGGQASHSVAITEDDKGRVIKRDYYPSDPQIAGLHDSYFLYDQQDRVLCETTSLVSACPMSGGNIKNSHSLSPPFTAAGNWKRVLRPIPGSTGLTNSFTDISGSHQISTVSQSDGSPILGDTIIRYDSRGNRNLDDNQSTLTNDDRTYLYDARRNVINVRGQYKTGSAWHYYNVSSAFDARNRRVFKQFMDETTLEKAQWFFYYDALDRLTEIRHTPDASVPSTYTVFQLFWLGNRLVLYWQTDYPSVTTSKRYVGTDESGRPIDMWCWGIGNCPRVWSINPSAWGVDTNLIGASVLQPISFAGQYRDDETAAWQNDGATMHRPGVALNGLRTYDSFTGSYLQVDPLIDETRSAYVYVDSDPVGKQDPAGDRARICRSTAVSTYFDGEEAIEIKEECWDVDAGGGSGGSGPSAGDGDDPRPRGPIGRGDGIELGDDEGIDPDPDPDKLRKDCFDRCDFKRSQDSFVCDAIPIWRWYDRIKCYEDADEARRKCNAECNKKHPERPIYPAINQSAFDPWISPP